MSNVIKINQDTMAQMFDLAKEQVPEDTCLVLPYPAYPLLMQTIHKEKWVVGNMEPNLLGIIVTPIQGVRVALSQQIQYYLEGDTKIHTCLVGSGNWDFSHQMQIQFGGPSL